MAVVGRELQRHEVAVGAGDDDLCLFDDHVVLRGVSSRSCRLRSELGPAAPQRVRRGLGLAVAGEDALLVAVDAVDADGGLEVGEVPDLLADEGRRCGRRPGGSCRGRRPGTPRSTAGPTPSACPAMVSAPYSVMMIGLPYAAPSRAAPPRGELSAACEVAGVDVPAVVAVEARARRTGRRSCRSRRVREHDVANVIGRVGSSSRVELHERLEVLARPVLVGVGLVGDAPHDDAGVVLVAGDQLADVLGVRRLGLVVEGVRREGRHDGPTPMKPA